jgi:ribosomal protein S12 methylthiotransferase accessory factor
MKVHQSFPRTQVNEGPRLHELLQLHGGLFRSAPVLQTTDSELGIVSRVLDSGDVGVVLPEGGERHTIPIRASGSGLDESSAMIPTLAEGLERYSTAVYRAEQFIWATASELSSEAIDLDTLPRCSTSELMHPKCPLRLPDKEQKIRWVRGIALQDGSLCWIPAIMVYSHIGYTVPAEKFWMPISTGCAAHSSYQSAIRNAIYELVERDILTVTWLQQLPLPRIELDHIPESLGPIWDRYVRSFGDVEYLFFDATSDLGIPTAYGIQIARFNARARTLVGCSTGDSMAEAVAKVMKDFIVLRHAFRKEWPTPASWDDFKELLHGATFMARETSASAFEFLIKSERVKTLSSIDPMHRESGIHGLLSLLKSRQMEAFAVDLSTDEALRANMRVVRVIIPALQPLSFRYRARFLGHSRLYSAPAAMGYEAYSEDQLNSWPQPFA